MTAQQALSTWPAIKAFGEGRKIQFRYTYESGHRWFDFTGEEPCFGESTLEWREKPSPRVLLVRYLKDGSKRICDDPTGIEPSHVLGTELVRFKEDVR